MASEEKSSIRNFFVYHSSNIVRVIKYMRLKWAGHVVRMEEVGSTFKILTGKSI